MGEAPGLMREGPAAGLSAEGCFGAQSLFDGLMHERGLSSSPCTLNCWTERTTCVLSLTAPHNLIVSEQKLGVVGTGGRREDGMIHVQ